MGVAVREKGELVECVEKDFCMTYLCLGLEKSSWVVQETGDTGWDKEIFRSDKVDYFNLSGKENGPSMLILST